VNDLSNKYAEIQNKIRYTLDILKPWKEPWYLEIEQIDEKLEEWAKFREQLSNNYLNIIEAQQNYRTEYDKLLRNSASHYIGKIDNDSREEIDLAINNNKENNYRIIDTFETHNTSPDSNETSNETIAVVV